MVNSKKIKVVKRADQVPAATGKRQAVTSRASARKMVSNVTDWVADLKVRKGEEAKAALEMLFAANRRPTES